MPKFRRATEADILLYFEWANDKTVRQYSINKSKIVFEDHVRWFKNKLADPDSIMLVFVKDNTEIGQLRIGLNNEANEAVINYSIDKDSRGRGFGTIILSEGWQYFSRLGKQMPLTGLVKVNNIPSVSAFIKAGFVKKDVVVVIQDERYFKFSRGT